MKIEILLSHLAGENTYIFYDENTKEAFIIDPGADSQIISNFINENKLLVKGILLTHGHFDHTFYTNDLKKEYNIPIYCSENEKEYCENAVLNLSNKYNCDLSVFADYLLKDNEEIKIGSSTLKVLFTPGHTPGSCCFYSKDDNLIFTGDTLFKRAHGRTDFVQSDYSKMVESLKRLFELPEETVVYAGHDQKTTIGKEKNRGLI